MVSPAQVPRSSLSSRTLALALIPLLACASRARAPSSTALPDERARRFEELRVLFHDAVLARDTVPPPTLSFSASDVTVSGTRVVARPILAESQPWNDWPDGSARLFNDGAGYLWEVSVSPPARWVAARTSLAVNDTEQTFPAAESADAVIEPLMRTAALEAMIGGVGELNLRVRAADAFRKAYLRDGAAGTGVVVFPAPSRQIHAVAMELHLGLVVDGVGPVDVRISAQ